MRFVPGSIVATPGALRACDEAGVSPLVLIDKHVKGDWGQLGAEDKRANQVAIQQGLRILSKYVEAGFSFYVITEADRSVTTLLLTEEY